MEKVGKIKQQNKDLVYNQLTEIAKQKGGTNILYPIILVLAASIISAILYMAIGITPQVKTPHINMPNI